MPVEILKLICDVGMLLRWNGSMDPPSILLAFAGSKYVRPCLESFLKLERSTWRTVDLPLLRGWMSLPYDPEPLHAVQRLRLKLE